MENKCQYFQQLPGGERAITYCKASTDINVGCRGMQAFCEHPLLFNTPKPPAQDYRAMAESLGWSKQREDHPAPQQQEPQTPLKIWMQRNGDY